MRRVPEPAPLVTMCRPLVCWAPGTGRAGGGAYMAGAGAEAWNTPGSARPDMGRSPHTQRLGRGLQSAVLTITDYLEYK